MSAASSMTDSAGNHVASIDTFRTGSRASYSVSVKNIGGMDSDEVVLVFMVPPRRHGIPTPKKQLLDFERVHVSQTNTTQRFKPCLPICVHAVWSVSFVWPPLSHRE